MRRKRAPRAVVRWRLIKLRFALEGHDLTRIVGRQVAQLDGLRLRHRLREGR